MKDFFLKRPLSWSAISSFEYSPEQWYDRYILNKKQPENAEMLFGKAFAKSVEARKPLVPVEIYKEVEYPLNVMFNGIKMTGYIDSYEPHSALREYKTSKTVWAKEKAEQHGQLVMYALMLYVQHKVKPEELTIHLDCIQTEQTGDFKIQFVKPEIIHTFPVTLTMLDILRFGQRILATVKAMDEYRTLAGGRTAYVAPASPSVSLPVDSIEKLEDKIIK